MLNNSARDLADVRKGIEGLAGKQLPIPTSLLVLTENGTKTSSSSRNAEELATEFGRITKGFHQNNCAEDWNNAALGTLVASTPWSLDEINRTQTRQETAKKIGNCLNEKFQLSFTALLDFAHRLQSVPGRAILVWMGPGWPILSGSEFPPETPSIREGFFRNLVNASTELREGQVTLDAVSWTSSLPVAKLDISSLETLTDRAATAAHASARSVALPALAHISGGQVYLQKKDLPSKVAACLADASSYYVLGFDAPPSNVPDEFRAIEVTVDKPGVTIRTNTGYYAQP
jgi:VWFA-related protein